MNAVFPEILFLGPYFAPLVLRAALAIVFLLHARALWRLATVKSKPLSGVEAALGFLLAAGLYTQLVAIAGILVVIFRTNFLGKSVQKETSGEMLATLGALGALILLGAGAFAFDLPY